ncbi:hypothetical protein Pmani_006855 [Petrolisthes manimaculis]|uniref:Uncharacterized protein n=1 Tax=Petrolisthes manimaculis TaxID=1843537 RepID=A0AAE1Q9J0_9EUCA|nr:hypothetical protein Pmani_006855 [Petrolisthes manimaculis]
MEQHILTPPLARALCDSFDYFQKVKNCSREGFQQNGWITLCGNISVLGDAVVGPSYGRCSRPLEVLLVLVRESGTERGGLWWKLWWLWLWE